VTYAAIYIGTSENYSLYAQTSKAYFLKKIINRPVSSFIFPSNGFLGGIIPLASSIDG